MCMCVFVCMWLLLLVCWCVVASFATASVSDESYLLLFVLNFLHFYCSCLLTTVCFLLLFRFIVIYLCLHWETFFFSPLHSLSNNLYTPKFPSLLLRWPTLSLFLAAGKRKWLAVIFLPAFHSFLLSLIIFNGHNDRWLTQDTGLEER